MSSSVWTIEGLQRPVLSCDKKNKVSLSKDLFALFCLRLCHSMCLFLRYLEWAVVPDRPRSSSRMEEDHRHGWDLLLAHSYRYHPVGEAGHPPSPPWTTGVVDPEWPHSNSTTQTVCGLPQPLTHSWPWGERAEISLFICALTGSCFQTLVS